VISAFGELDMASARVLQAACARARTGTDRLTLDLRGLTFIDSSGLRCILMLHQETQRDGRGLTLIPGVPTVQRVFELSGTDTMLPFA
jgi:anti-anti-sigma factor